MNQEQKYKQLDNWMKELKGNKEFFDKLTFADKVYYKTCFILDDIFDWLIKKLGRD